MVSSLHMNDHLPGPDVYVYRDYTGPLYHPMISRHSISISLWLNTSGFLPSMGNGQYTTWFLASLSFIFR